MHWLFHLANSQSRSLRESKTRSSPTDAGNVVECLPPAQKTSISQHSNHDSTDTEDSDDSSDEKVNQVGSLSCVCVCV